MCGLIRISILNNRMCYFFHTTSDLTVIEKLHDKESHYSLIFESPAYWQAINSIIDGELFVAYISDGYKPICWMPYVLKTHNNIKLCNSMPYYGSHGGPFGPQSCAYSELLKLFFEHCTKQEIDTIFVALSIGVRSIVERSSFSGKIIDDRIGQINILPKYDRNLENSLFAIVVEGIDIFYIHNKYLFYDLFAFNNTMVGD